MVKSLKHTIQTEDEEAQQDAAHRMILIAEHWTIRRWSVSKLSNGSPPVRLPKANASLIDVERIEQDRAKLKTVLER